MINVDVVMTVLKLLVLLLSLANGLLMLRKRLRRRKKLEGQSKGSQP